MVNPRWAVQGSGKLGKTLGEQPGHSLTQGKASSLAGLWATWAQAHTLSLDNPTLRRGLLPRILGLETQEGPLAPVVLDGVSKAIPRAREQGVVAGTATWGLFGGGPMGWGVVWVWRGRLLPLSSAHDDISLGSLGLEPGVLGRGPFWARPGHQGVNWPVPQLLAATN